MEARGVKRRRVESPSRRKSTYKSADDEETEFLVAETQEDGTTDDDPLSTFSKETRELMEKAGLVVPKRPGTDEEELVEDEVKVTNRFELVSDQQQADISLDILCLQNPFTANPVHIGTSPAVVSCVCFDEAPGGRRRYGRS